MFSLRAPWVSLCSCIGLTVVGVVLGANAMAFASGAPSLSGKNFPPASLGGGLAQDGQAHHPSSVLGGFSLLDLPHLADTGVHALWTIAVDVTSGFEFCPARITGATDTLSHGIAPGQPERCPRPWAKAPAGHASAPGSTGRPAPELPAQDLFDLWEVDTPVQVCVGSAHFFAPTVQVLSPPAQAPARSY